MNVLLICYGGLSTGLMKAKIEEQALKENYNDLKISAIAIAEAPDDLSDYDVVFLGPQIRYAIDDIKKRTNGKPVISISAPDFGMMRGDNVWKQIVQTLNS